MSIHPGDTYSDVQRSSSPNANTAQPLSFCAWFRVSPALATEGTLFAVQESGVATNCALVTDASDGLLLKVYDGTYTSTGFSLTLNTWAHVAMTKNASDLWSVYVNGASVVTPFTHAPTTLTDNKIFVAGSGALQSYYVESAKLWTAALTLEEIKIEAVNVGAVRRTNLWGAWGLTTTTDLSDTSGNSRDLATLVSITNAEAPPYVLPGYGGLSFDDRFRFRPSHFHGGGTSTRGSHRSAWADDARDMGLRDTLRDNNTRTF